MSSVPDVDVERFPKANIYNWLIGGTDGHAKNYSFLIDAGDEVRLAPFYDLPSQLPYPDLIKPQVAMKMGAHYDIARIDARDWRMLARNCAIEEERLITQIDELTRALPDAISAARAQAHADGLSKRVIDRLAKILIAHAQERGVSIRHEFSRSATRYRRV